MSFLWHDWAGYIGVVLVLLAFLLLQARKLHGNGLVYQLMNVLGAVGVMLSLLFGSFNTSAFVMQVAWLIIGIYGMANSARVRRELRDVERKIGS
ncbi:CBU_0592 family membrane protein [Dyella koreensis]|uniref:CBU-0592-like domain-containing protein n=1 Tax=Dyella koreensis TaxID=311235 RepID=A0ABW8KA39_9GAMM